MKKHKEIFLGTAADLRKWLITHHNESDSYWLVKWKKLPDKPFISYDELVDELICFGWVDSLPKKLDDERTMIRISPRSPKSNWSGVNKARVKRLQSEGRMHESGLRMVAIAKENGCWDFLNDVEKLIVPVDLQTALHKYDKAQFYFDRFPDSSKRGILEWIKTAKQEATRLRRIEETAQKASHNIKANHPKGRDQGPKG